MPGGLDGLELARIVENRCLIIQVIVTSSHQQLADADIPAASTFLPKPNVTADVARIILDTANPERS